MTIDGAPESDLAVALATAAQVLANQPDVAHTLDCICELAVELVPQCECAGVAFVVGKKVTSAASSGEVALIFDSMQQEIGDGPALKEVWEQEIVEVEDLSHESRWPGFAEQASTKTGTNSVLSVRLFLNGEVLGVLSLFSPETDAFDAEARRTAVLLAAHAAVALDSAGQKESLNTAIDSRDLIGQAKGIIMARDEVDADEAFAMLVKASQDLNKKLRLVAEEVVAKRL